MRRHDEARRYTVRGIRRDPVDVGKLSKALLGLVMAEAERQAQAEHTTQAQPPDRGEVIANPPSPEQKGGGDASNA
ncbi:MAG: hypothetical protein ACRDRL_15185 [Sciscionella sp.]